VAGGGMMVLGLYLNGTIVGGPHLTTDENNPIYVVVPIVGRILIGFGALMFIYLALTIPATVRNIFNFCNSSIFLSLDKKWSRVVQIILGF
jgi:hypothetical protein